MYLKLRYQQPKTTMYIQTAILIPHNCKTKIYIDTTQKKKKEYKHNTKGSHQITREQKRKGERKRCTKASLKQLTKWQKEHVHACLLSHSVVSDSVPPYGL